MPSSIMSRVSSVRSKVSDTIQKVKKKAKNTVKSITSAASADERKLPLPELRRRSAYTLVSREVDDDIKATWKSEIYQFFDSNVVTKKDDNGRTFQQFSCTALGGCKKHSGFKGVHWYQTKLDGEPASDCSSTSNPKKHAETCWGKDVVKACLAGSCIVNLLDNYNGRLSLQRMPGLPQIIGPLLHGRFIFNTRASHLSFYSMFLRSPSLTLAKFLLVNLMRCWSVLVYSTSAHSHHPILAWVGDNAMVNDTQNTALGNSAHNTFWPENHVHCFTHTLNLGVKSFLCPFQPPIKKKGTAAIDDDDSDMDDGDMDSELSLELDDNESLPDLADASDTESMVDEEDQDAWDQMDEADKADMLAQTKAAKSVISQIRNFSFALVHSTAKALSACKAKKMAVRLLPRDVHTRWNSTYDMLVVAVQYKEVRAVRQRLGNYRGLGLHT
ncbi:hypothetical protein B0H14DRAFT_2596298 [Mycena olivaceomarginata]|nr:hypothetical protein B0H14DRAFT_2596298 [Mycena olivaceomarginata]